MKKIFITRKLMTALDYKEEATTRVNQFLQVYQQRNLSKIFSSPITRELKMISIHCSRLRHPMIWEDHGSTLYGSRLRISYFEKKDGKETNLRNKKFLWSDRDGVRVNSSSTVFAQVLHTICFLQTLFRVPGYRDMKIKRAYAKGLQIYRSEQYGCLNRNWVYFLCVLRPS